VRQAVLHRYELGDAVPELRGRRLVDELLEPCAIYAPAVLALVRDGLVHAAAHITGGGLRENVPRVLPAGMGAEIGRGTWREHPVFALVQAAAGASDDDMFATFNMGLGMVLVVDPGHADEVLARTAAHAPVRIGRIGRGPGVRIR
jgi:phosphoribosylformylglycinamidine cyclo-ligase